MEFNVRVQDSDKVYFVCQQIREIIKEEFNTFQTNGLDNEISKDGDIQHGKNRVLSYSDYWVKINSEKIDPEIIMDLLEDFPVTYSIT